MFCINGAKYDQQSNYVFFIFSKIKEFTWKELKSCPAVFCLFILLLCVSYDLMLITFTIMHFYLSKILNAF